MFKVDHKKAQAATELAVFGAILIFLVGAIARTAMGNSYTQNQNFKAMRMAMLSSWRGAQQGNISRNNASILFVEDRLSPDINKYGQLDRNPFIASGAGTFTNELLYPLDPDQVSSNLQMMDVYINGVYFPFTTQGFVIDREITRPQSCSYPAGSCAQNQCLRNQREWVGGIAYQNQFGSVIQVPLDKPTPQGVPMGQAIQNSLIGNEYAIFNALVNQGIIILAPGAIAGSATQGLVNQSFTSMPSPFYITDINGNSVALTQAQINQIQAILLADKYQYKLFYTMVPNGTSQYTTTPPSCSSHPCKNNELSSDVSLPNTSGGMTNNLNGDLMFDLKRIGATNDQLEKMTNPVSSPAVPLSMRPYMSWEWAATAGTTAEMIGLDAGNNQYPTYDFDGRLKEQSIYGISQNPSNGDPIVTYVDSAAGDIDLSWDTNTCAPKSGLQSDAQIMTFTQDGTYLLIKEGKLYNPETDQFVRSQNQNDSVDLIQRTIQLSNNTHRFCDDSGHPLATVANDGVTPNPVEVCIGEASSDNCFNTENNIKSTCFDAHGNVLFVRSRLKDHRGHFWMTDTSGQMQVK